MTTGGFSSKQLLDEEQILKLPSLTNNDAIEIGQIAITLGSQRKLPSAIEVRISDWIVNKFNIFPKRWNTFNKFQHLLLVNKISTILYNFLIIK